MDMSNLLIADNLLKIVWFFNAPWFATEALAIKTVEIHDGFNAPYLRMKHWLIPWQTVMGKDQLNPFMVVMVY